MLHTHTQDEDSKKNHLAGVLNKVSSDTSEEDNELGDETISGENDVEYAEFSLSVQTSPKEQIHNSNSIENCNNANGGESAFDDFMDLPISAHTSNVSSKCNKMRFNFMHKM